MGAMTEGFVSRRSRDLIFLGIRVPQVPKAFMRGHEAFHIAAACAIGRQRPASQHHLQNMEKLLSNLKITLITGMMKRDQYFIGQAPAIAWRPSWACFATDILVSLAHPGPHLCSFG